MKRHGADYDGDRTSSLSARASYRRCVVFCFVWAQAAGAAVCTQAPAGEPRHAVQLFAGYSPASPLLIGTAPDRRFVMAGLGYEYRCWNWQAVSISYTAGVMPVAVLLQPRTVAAPRHAVYGFAVTPVGMIAEFARARRLHPFMEFMGGIIASTEPIPIRAANATGLNFIIDVGGGLEWRVRQRAAVRFGYKLVHISNAGTTSFNPGVDNNVVYVGYVVRR